MSFASHYPNAQQPTDITITLSFMRSIQYVTENDLLFPDQPQSAAASVASFHTANSRNRPEFLPEAPLRHIIDTMHERSVQIYEEKKRMLEQGDEALKDKVFDTWGEVSLAGPLAMRALR